MKYDSVSDMALARLVMRVWRSRGGFMRPIHAITVAGAAMTEVRLVDIGPTVHVIGSWSVHERADVPDMIRLVEARDRHIAGLVFCDSRTSAGCFWEFVDPYTLEPSRMFMREWRESYGEI